MAGTGWRVVYSCQSASRPRMPAKLHRRSSSAGSPARGPGRRRRRWCRPRATAGTAARTRRPRRQLLLDGGEEVGVAGPRRLVLAGIGHHARADLVEQGQAHDHDGDRGEGHARPAPPVPDPGDGGVEQRRQRHQPEEGDDDGDPVPRPDLGQPARVGQPRQTPGHAERGQHDDRGRRPRPSGVQRRALRRPAAHTSSDPSATATPTTATSPRYWYGSLWEPGRVSSSDRWASGESRCCGHRAPGAGRAAARTCRGPRWAAGHLRVQPVRPVPQQRGDRVDRGGRRWCRRRSAPPTPAGATSAGPGRRRCRRRRSRARRTPCSRCRTTPARRTSRGRRSTGRRGGRRGRANARRRASSGVSPPAAASQRDGQRHGHRGADEELPRRAQEVRGGEGEHEGERPADQAGRRRSPGARRRPTRRRARTRA